MSSTQMGLFSCMVIYLKAYNKGISANEAFSYMAICSNSLQRGHQHINAFALTYSTCNTDI